MNPQEAIELKRARNREYMRIYRLKYPERVAASVHRWRGTPEGKERYREYMRNYREANRERLRIYMRKRLGTPTPAHPRPSVCEACGDKPGKKGLAADHSHMTGLARGWLCDNCNRGLGLLGDELAGIERMRAYLLRYSSEMGRIQT